MPQTLESASSGGDAERRLVERGPQLTLLLHADDLTRPSERYLLDGRAEVRVQRGPRSALRLEAGQAVVPFEDPYASGRHARLWRDAGGWWAADVGSRNGTFVDGTRLARGEARRLGETALLELGHTFFHFRARAEAEQAAAAVREAGRAAERGAETLNLAWERELSRLERLAPTTHDLLVQGESGAGKEVLAQHLHARSGRPGPLVSVNCAAMTEALLDDELFGHTRGAFSGAVSDRQGLLRAAHGGTLLLDEVGDMPPALQGRLLRVLENHRVRPLGSERELEVDVRVIAATHRDLAALVAAGTFRHDLLARLGLLPVRVPAVRERPEDLGLLVRAILREPCPGLDSVRFEVEALRSILGNPWPLNVRELRRAVLAAFDLGRSEGGQVVWIRRGQLAADAPAAEPPAAAPERLAATAASGPRLGPEEADRRAQLVYLLRKHGGNVAAVARELGQARSSVQRSMARLGVGRRPGGTPDAGPSSAS